MEHKEEGGVEEVSSTANFRSLIVTNDIERLSDKGLL